MIFEPKIEIRTIEGNVENQRSQITNGARTIFESVKHRLMANSTSFARRD
jgi:hypothetical protein